MSIIQKIVRAVLDMIQMQFALGMKKGIIKMQTIKHISSELIGEVFQGEVAGEIATFLLVKVTQVSGCEARAVFECVEFGCPLYSMSYSDLSRDTVIFA